MKKCSDSEEDNDDDRRIYADEERDFRERGSRREYGRGGKCGDGVVTIMRMVRTRSEDDDDVEEEDDDDDEEEEGDDDDDQEEDSDDHHYEEDDETSVSKLMVDDEERDGRRARGALTRCRANIWREARSSARSGGRGGESLTARDAAAAAPAVATIAG
ncbi:unnamed protein product [Lampetra planeri]